MGRPPIMTSAKLTPPPHSSEPATHFQPAPSRPGHIGERLNSHSTSTR
jgi:hypothetical protein